MFYTHTHTHTHTHTCSHMVRTGEVVSDNKCICQESVSHLHITTYETESYMVRVSHYGSEQWSLIAYWVIVDGRGECIWLVTCQNVASH
jgi:hypothetical protein